MIQTANGEIEIEKDYKKVIMYALAFLLALVIITYVEWFSVALL